MAVVIAGPLAYLLRLAEGIPATTDNRQGRHELIQGLNNLLNQVEKDDDD